MRRRSCCLRPSRRRCAPNQQRDGDVLQTTSVRAGTSWAAHSRRAAEGTTQPPSADTSRSTLDRFLDGLRLFAEPLHLLQEDASGIDRPAARLLELTWSRRLATDSYLQSEHATKHHVCSCLGGCHTGRRPWSARTGRAWLLGVSEESAPRPLEAFVLVRSCSGRRATKF